MHLMYKKFNLTVLKIDFTFDQDKVFNFKNFDQLAEVGLKKITEQRSRALVLTSYFYSFALERTF